ncbi:AAA-ATPase At2g46620-like [Musa acuminata AAA Group]|uniref:AAA-ATPase At2g46620-like n=1 Tax=Musa acuminata AAA Group TaxID=214697 RepID=UPI0031D0700D
MFPSDPVSVVVAVLGGLFLLRAGLSFKCLLYLLGRWWSWLDEHTHAYQHFEIPRYTESGLENPLIRHATAYVATLSSHECAGAPAVAIVSSGYEPNEFSLHPAPGHPVPDSFLGCRLSWSATGGGNRLVLRLRRQDCSRVLRPYLQHVESVAKNLELRRRETNLFVISSGGGESGEPRWRPVAPFTHPARLDTVAMDPEVKAWVRADLEAFLNGRAYYHRVGRNWRRSYLLHGPPGTGKTSFAAAIANFLCYDVYDLDLALVSDGIDLKALLLATGTRSVILVEDLDLYLSAKGGHEGNSRHARMLNFMDGVLSCCGDEKVMVYTMTSIEAVAAAVLREGWLDVHIHFPMCDFQAFKTLARIYLRLNDHKLYPMVEEVFQSGAKMSPAKVGEIMIANRGSPKRALKLVITELQHLSSAPNLGQQLLERKDRGGDEPVAEDDPPTVREIGRWCGVIRTRSRGLC